MPGRSRLESLPPYLRRSSGRSPLVDSLGGLAAPVGETGPGCGRTRCVPDIATPRLTSTTAPRTAAWVGLEEVAAVVGVELGESEVVEDEEVGFGEGGEELGVAAVAAGDGEFVQEPGDAQVQCGEAVAAGVVSECTGEPGLADAGGSGDEDVEAFAQPTCGGEGVDECLVEAPWVAIVDVLDAGVGVSQLGTLQSAGHAAVVAQGEPPRVSRRVIGLSQAAIADSCSW